MTVAMRAQVILPYDSGLPRDVAVNTWHFFSDTETDDQQACDDVTVALQGFYDAISGWLSTFINPVWRIRYYTSGVDFSSLPFNREDAPTPLTISVATSLPLEVSICSSYAASVGGTGTTNAAQRRGRHYIGPLNTGASSSGTNQPARPTTAMIDDVSAAAHDVIDSLSTSSMNWVVLSRATGGAFSMVDHGWVDNEFDTQRRRGVESTARTSWTNP